MTKLQRNIRMAFGQGLKFSCGYSAKWGALSASGWLAGCRLARGLVTSQKLAVRLTGICAVIELASSQLRLTLA